jgi:hypothetical protein
MTRHFHPLLVHSYNNIIDSLEIGPSQDFCLQRAHTEKRRHIDTVSGSRAQNACARVVEACSCLRPRGNSDPPEQIYFLYTCFRYVLQRVKRIIESLGDLRRC